MSKKLFDKYVMPASGKLFRYANSILKDEEKAQDAVQECLMKIWERKEQLKDVKNIEAWTMRIVRNQCYDWIKMNRYTVLNDQDYDREDSHHADNKMITSDQMQWLNQILNTLPEKQREIFQLREIEEMPYQDIAEILNISLSDVKINLHRTRSKIKLEMEKIESYGIAN